MLARDRAGRYREAAWNGRKRMPRVDALPSETREVDLADLDATGRLGERLAALVAPGDVIALGGDLGAGKTALARALIGAAGGGGDVPSPTFTLVQTYATPRGTIWHFDLYRIEDAVEAYELAIEDAFADGISLIEWPDRLGALLPAERLDIVLTLGVGPTGRRATITGHGAWVQRMAGLDHAV